MILNYSFRCYSGYIFIIIDLIKKSNVVNRFNKWNSVDIKELIKMKKGAVADEEDFLKTTGDNFSLYY